jgi:hypothetical protein
MGIGKNGEDTKKHIIYWCHILKEYNPYLASVAELNGLN